MRLVILRVIQNFFQRFYESFILSSRSNRYSDVIFVEPPEGAAVPDQYTILQQSLLKFSGCETRISNINKDEVCMSREDFEAVDLS